MASSARQDSPTFYLEVSGPEQEGSRYEVGPDGLLVGRSSACDLVFESREVSRRHAYFYPSGGSCHVKDLGSKNGTVVNGQRSREMRLRDGDVAEIGSSSLILRVEGSAQRPAAKPAERPLEFAAGLTGQGHPLAMLALVFGALSYLHWAFGLGAVVLAFVSLREIKAGVHVRGRAFALGGLALGACGGLLNAWFVELAPRWRDQAEQYARLECRDRLIAIGDALRNYGEAHGGALPARLGELADDGFLTPAVLECPGPLLNGPGPATYLYFAPSGPYLGTSGDVIACDADPAYHQGEGGWILRADRRIEWLSADAFVRILEETASARSMAPAAAPAREGRGP